MYLKHGHTPGNGKLCKRSRTYASWTMMKQRCYNKNNVSFPRYGGSGVTVCERWEQFINFLADMGERPAGKTLDRIDRTGDYEPGNCRWATPKEQAANRKIYLQRDSLGRWVSKGVEA